MGSSDTQTRKEKSPRRCTKCGYELTGIGEAKACPECGHNIAETQGTKAEPWNFSNGDLFASLLAVHRSSAGVELRCNPGVLRGWSLIWLAAFLAMAIVVVLATRSSSLPASRHVVVYLLLAAFAGVPALVWLLMIAPSRDTIERWPVLIHVSPEGIASIPNSRSSGGGKLLAIKVHSVRHRTRDSRNHEGGGRLAHARQVIAIIETADGTSMRPIIRLHVIFGLRHRIRVLDEFARQCGVPIEYSVEEHEHDEAEHR